MGRCTYRARGHTITTHSIASPVEPMLGLMTSTTCVGGTATFLGTKSPSGALDEVVGLTSREPRTWNSLGPWSLEIVGRPLLGRLSKLLGVQLCIFQSFQITNEPLLDDDTDDASGFLFDDDQIPQSELSKHLDGILYRRFGVDRQW